MVIKKCPDCGFYHIHSTLFGALPRFLVWLLPIQAGECTKCQRPCIRAIGYPIAVRWLVCILILGLCFVLGISLGRARPLAAKTFMTHLGQYRIQNLIPLNLKKEAEIQEGARGVEIDKLKQRINDLEGEIIQHKDRSSSLESQLTMSNLKIGTTASVNHSDRTQTNIVLEDEPQSVLKTVERWRRAWQSQNVKDYLVHYTSEFGNSNGKSRKLWLKDRRVKITRPKSIAIMIDNIQLTKLASHIWEATFRQLYQSDIYGDVVIKTLRLKKVGNRYLIDSERSSLN